MRKKTILHRKRWILPALPLFTAGLLFSCSTLAENQKLIASMSTWRTKIAEIRLLAENNTPTAYQEAKQLQMQLPADANAGDQIKVLNLLARIETNLALSDQALAHAQQALALASHHSDRLGMAEAELNIAFELLNQGKIDGMAAATIHSQSLLQKDDPPELLAESRLRVAVMYRRLGKLDDSISIAVQAMEEARQNGNPLMLAYAHQALGISYIQSSHFTEALGHFTQMREQARTAHSKLLEAYAMMGISQAQHDVGNLRGSEETAQQYITLCKETGSPLCLSLALVNLAENLRSQHRNAEALPLYNEAESTYAKHPNKIGNWWVLNNRSLNYQALGEFEKSLADAKRAYELAKEIGFPLYLNSSTKRLSEIYAHKNDFRQAYAYAIETIDMARKEANDFSGARIAELAKRYETENKQRQIDELTRGAQLQEAETRQRWLWTVLIGSTGILIGMTYFLLRLRRSRQEIGRLNANLEQRVEDRTMELIQREQEYRTLAENSPNFIVRYNKGYRHTYVNPAYECLIGTSAKECLNKTLNEISSAFFSEAFQEKLSHVLESGVADEIEVVGNSVDGHKKWGVIHLVPEQGQDGSVSSILGIGHDITDRKLREWQEETRLGILEQLAHGGELADILGLVAKYVETPSPGFTCNIRLLNDPADSASANTRLTDNRLDPRTIWSEPILDSSGKSLGALVLCHPTNTAPSDDTLTLARQASHLAAIAIERKSIDEKLQHQASYDALTGLPNRRLFNDRLSEEIAKASRSNHNVAVLFIDLDRFKEVNDTLGHEVGDKLLIEASQRIRRSVRESDTVARLGGDEFVVIIPGFSKIENLSRVAQTLIDELTHQFNIGQHTAYVSASIGIAAYPIDADHADFLVSCADQAMYAAKEKGRNGYSFFTNKMQAEMQHRLMLANELRDALALGQLEAYFQPIIDIASKRVVKAEALLRWKHPQHGMIPPNQFVPIAEDIGAIHEIGDWIFRQSAQLAQRWTESRQENGNEDIPCQVSVNISPLQFVRSDISDNWIAHLKTIGLPAKHVVAEITESLLLSEQTDVTGKLRKFREAGMEVALDDFGTGYSAMAYLKRFNIDYLKIDRSFVRELEIDINDRAIAEAIIVMAHKLGLKVIAEGVETTEQQALLAAVGCEYIQGYLYAKPMPAQQFLEFVQTADNRFIDSKLVTEIS